MQRKKLWLFGGVALAMFVALAMVNVWEGQLAQRLAERQQVAICVDDACVAVATHEEIARLSQPIYAVFQRKVGGAEVHRYQGVPLSTLLAQHQIVVLPDGKVDVVAVDNYCVSLNNQEIARVDNVYLVYEQDGQPLDNGSGAYMLVVKDDAISSRWSKNVVQIEVYGGNYGT